jgi:hypothetical protein
MSNESKEMLVHESVIYTIGEFEWRGKHYLIKYRSKKENPTMRKNEELWIE